MGYRPDSDNMIEALNFKYFGPVDGHDLQGLIDTLQELKSVEGPKFLHVITKKGKGLQKAEEDQVKYHAPGKFEPHTGELLPKTDRELPAKFQDVFGLTLLELAEKNEKIIGITPAMPTGSSLKYMMESLPDRAFDVGIAEQHAVTLAAGMATQGFTVFCAIYSTFLQRAYDQLIHDVALQDLPVIFCLDRAGLVGEDGPTHHGVFDIAYCRAIPNLMIMAPRNELELRNMIYTVQLGVEHPVVIRYPRGRGYVQEWKKDFEKIEFGKSCLLKDGNHIAVLSLGNMAHHVEKAIEELGDDSKIAHYDMRFVKPLDTEQLDHIFRKFEKIVTVEDGCKTGGFGSAVLEYASDQQFKGKIHVIGVPDTFISHGSVAQLQEIAEISVEGIKRKLNSLS